MCTENINLKYKNIFTSFDQYTAEFYDNLILLTVICIFWSEFDLKPRYFALHLTEKFLMFKKVRFPLDVMQTIYSVVET